MLIAYTNGHIVVATFAQRTTMCVLSKSHCCSTILLVERSTSSYSTSCQCSYPSSRHCTPILPTPATCNPRGYQTSRWNGHQPIASCCVYFFFSILHHASWGHVCFPSSVSQHNTALCYFACRRFDGHTQQSAHLPMNKLRAPPISC